MVGRTARPTAAQKRRLDALHRIACVACEIDGLRQPNRTEAHHLTDKGNREASGGHDATVALCAWHHRGMPVGSWRPSMMAVAYGPSRALNKRAFVGRYGSDRDLLALTNAALEKASSIQQRSE